MDTPLEGAVNVYVDESYPFPSLVTSVLYGTIALVATLTCPVLSAVNATVSSFFLESTFILYQYLFIYCHSHYDST